MDRFIIASEDEREWLLGCEHECHTYKETP